MIGLRHSILLVGLIACGESVGTTSSALSEEVADASVVADAGSPSTTDAAAEPADDSSTTMGDDASTVPDAAPVDAGPPPILYCDAEFTSPGLVYGVYEMCGRVDGVDTWTQCTIGGVQTIWRCSSGTPNPCPQLTICCVQDPAFGPATSCSARTTRSCVDDGQCAGYPENTSLGHPVCAQETPTAKVCVPF